MTRATEAELPVLILAGGRGSRLGGLDKSSLILADDPRSNLLQRALARYSGLGPLSVASGTHPCNPGPGVTALPDPADFSPHSGPLAALLAGFRQRLATLGPGPLLTCPVDLLAPTPDCLQALAGTLLANPVLALVRALHRHRIEPLVAAWSVTAELIDAASTALRAGQRAVHRWQADLPHWDLPTPPDEPDWYNLNTPTDLEAFQRRTERFGQ